MRRPEKYHSQGSRMGVENFLNFFLLARLQYKRMCGTICGVLRDMGVRWTIRQGQRQEDNDNGYST